MTGRIKPSWKDLNTVDRGPQVCSSGLISVNWPSAARGGMARGTALRVSTSGKTRLIGRPLSAPTGANQRV